MKPNLFLIFTVALLIGSISLYAQEEVPIPHLFPINKSQLATKTQKLHLSIVNNNYDLKYHRFYWFINPSQRYISGSVTSYFEATSIQMNSIQFELDSTLTVDSATYAGTKAETSHTGKLVSINLIPSVPYHHLDSVTLFYHGVPPTTGFGSFENYVHNGFPSMWTLSEPYGASDWWPSKNDLTDKIDSIDVFVVVPNGNHVAGNGLLLSEKPYDSSSTIAHWKHRYPIASYLIAIGVTNYARYSDYYVNGKDSLEILNYVYPEDSAAIRSTSVQIVKAIALFEHFFGSYPFKNEKYGHAECNMSGGMEHQTMTFLGRTEFGFYTMNHELGHQWFGDMVTCGSWEDIWLNEGFATFSMLLCYQYLLPDDYWYKVVLQEMKKSIVSKPQGSVFCTDTTNVSRIFYSNLSYFKGAYLLQMLRLLLGDNDFFQGIRNYLNDPALKYHFARTVDLKRHLEMQSGKDLTQFFADWFYGSGVPGYSISVEQQLNYNTTLTINQTQLGSNVGFFNMVLPIKFKGAGKDSTIIFDNNFTGQTFDFNPGFKIDSVFFDPDLKILYSTVEVALNHNPSSVNLIRNNDNIQIRQNPVKEVLKLVGQPAIINSIQIISLEGRNTVTIPINKQCLPLEINIRDFKAGMYILKVITSDEIVTKKFIITK